MPAYLAFEAQKLSIDHEISLMHVLPRLWDHDSRTRCESVTPGAQRPRWLK
jgi:hypothetical protein